MSGSRSSLPSRGSSSAPLPLFGGLVSEPDVDTMTVAAPASGSLGTVTFPDGSTMSGNDMLEIVTQATLENASFVGPFMSTGGGGMSSGGDMGMADFMDPSLYAGFEELAPTMPSPYASATLLKPPASLAFQETTFGRRLQRLAIERALKLISSRSPDPQTFRRVFGFVSLFESPDAVKQRLRACLDANLTTTLDYWRYPFLNLGGAGTFMASMLAPTAAASGNGSSAGAPAAESEGNIGSMDDILFGPSAPETMQPFGNQAPSVEHLLRPKWANPYLSGGAAVASLSSSRRRNRAAMSMGPWSAHVLNALDRSLDQNLRILLKGFEGDWFDCDEVELALRLRGIYISHGADYVQATVDREALESISASTTVSSAAADNPTSSTSGLDWGFGGTAHKGKIRPPALLGLPADGPSAMDISGSVADLALRHAQARRRAEAAAVTAPSLDFVGVAAAAAAAAASTSEPGVDGDLEVLKDDVASSLGDASLLDLSFGMMDVDGVGNSDGDGSGAGDGGGNGNNGGGDGGDGDGDDSTLWAAESGISSVPLAGGTDNNIAGAVAVSQEAMSSGTGATTAGDAAEDTYGFAQQPDPIFAGAGGAVPLSSSSIPAEAANRYLVPPVVVSSPRRMQTVTLNVERFLSGKEQ